jgi:hypothetical protein
MKKQTTYRSAKSGRYVSKEDASRNPNTTVKETNKVTKKK